MPTKVVRQSERTTLQEVATLAGVSASTVSLVLSGNASKRRIAVDTRTRVSRAAEDLNYAPNLLTRSLRKGRTQILSFFSAFRYREEADLYMDNLSSAIETAGGHAGYDILVHCNFNRSPKEIYQFLNGGLADGLILFAPATQDPLLTLLHKSSLPVVILNGRDPERRFPSVVDDVEAGIDAAAHELFKLGHQRIALFTDKSGGSRDSNRRVKLIREKLAALGISIPDRWVIPSGEDAREVLAELLAETHPPTAIFCWHDRLAFGVLASCESLGIQVPNQISIVGYDGLHWPSATKHIAASVNVDHHGHARMAVQLLDEYINGYEGPLREEVVPVTFTTGTSLGPANALQRSNS